MGWRICMLFILVTCCILRTLADAASRSPTHPPTSSSPLQEARILPTSKDECSGISIFASTIARQREEGIPLQRLRAEYTKGFTRNDRSPSPKVFSPFERAALLGWLSQDLYGPSAFLSSMYANKAAEIWCHTALTKSDPQHIPFTLAFLTAVCVCIRYETGIG
jgi:hypothetical protein